MHGRFFDVSDAPMVLGEPVTPTVLIGGGGSKMMNLGGRVADIVSMIPRQATGEWSVAASVADSTLERMAQKARWVHEGAEEAGRGTGLRYISIFDPGDDQVEYLANRGGRAAARRMTTFEHQRLPGSIRGIERGW
jgi:alkanesulfonate monooxygenase SsuD/methylene tetrahydromethanopterin reductase-like flavin-dependent oxidoreductase (luciferase family)